MPKKLCRLCRSPVMDGGVKMRTLDQTKLSKWWLENLQTEFKDDDGRTLKNICKFCVWDARYKIT
jgi:hypothetical protein